MKTPTLVSPPDRAPVPYGLFSVLEFRGDADRWINGVTYPGTSCGPAQHYGLDVCNDEEAGLPDTGREARPMKWGTADSFLVEGTFTCTPVGLTPEEMESYALQDLELHEEASVEAHFLEILTASSADSGTAVTAETVTSSADTPRALGALEHYAARTYGSPGVLHLSRGLAADARRYLETRGGRLYTRIGTPVALSTAIEPDALTFYVTPSLLAYRSAARIVGDTETLFERGRNTLTTLAQRDYLIGLDTCPIGYVA